jgi:hypothetical protein
MVGYAFLFLEKKKKKKSLSPCLSVFKNWDGEGKLIVKKMKNMLRTLI